jgi:hypothetical protein
MHNWHYNRGVYTFRRLNCAMTQPLLEHFQCRERQLLCRAHHLVELESSKLATALQCGTRNVICDSQSCERNVASIAQIVCHSVALNVRMCTDWELNVYDCLLMPEMCNAL